MLIEKLIKELIKQLIKELTIKELIKELIRELTIKELIKELIKERKATKTRGGQLEYFGESAVGLLLGTSVICDVRRLTF